jgi:hypothetical protein
MYFVGFKVKGGVTGFLCKSSELFVAGSFTIFQPSGLWRPGLLLRSTALGSLPEGTFRR